MDQLSKIRNEHAKRFELYKLQSGNAQHNVCSEDQQNLVRTKRKERDSNVTESILNEEKLYNKQNNSSIAKFRKVLKDEGSLVNEPESCKEESFETVSDVLLAKINEDCKELENEFNILCWNIDGLDENYLILRMMSVVELVELKRPAAVLLQEVVPPALNYLKKRLSSQYLFVEPNPEGSGSNSLVPYFCVILVYRKKFIVKRGKFNIIFSCVVKKLDVFNAF